jgi:hypothetical protein
VIWKTNVTKNRYALQKKQKLEIYQPLFLEAKLNKF